MAESKRSRATEPAGGTTPAGGNRRHFAVELAAWLVGSILALGPMLIGLFAFLDPLGRRKRVPTAYQQAGGGGKEGYYRIAELDALTAGSRPQRFQVISVKRDAWNFIPDQPVGAVFVERTGEQEVRVFNATCPHAGCSVDCDGTAYLCPCHNSAFNLDGSKRESEAGRENPSRRPLDELRVDEDRLAAGEIWVEYMNFYTGIEEKKPKA